MQIIVLPERERTKWSVAQTLWDMDRTPLISPCANNFQDFNASLHGLNEVRRTCWLLRGLMGCWLAQRGRRDNRVRWLSRLIKNEGAEVSCQAADPAPALKSLGDVLSLPVLSPPLLTWGCDAAEERAGAGGPIGILPGLCSISRHSLSPSTPPLSNYTLQTKAHNYRKWDNCFPRP